MKIFSGILKTISAACLLLAASIVYASDTQNEPVGYWPLNEGFGNKAHDDSAYHNDGTIHGAKWAKGSGGSALEFTEPSNFVSVPSRDIFNFDEEFTFSAWIYPFSVNGGTIISKCGNGHLAGYSFELSNGTVSVVVKTENNANGRSGYNVKSAKVLKEKNWAQVTVTYNVKENKLKLFHNGEKIKEAPANGRLRFKTVWEDGIGAQFAIGANANFPARYGQFFGLIREVMVYGKSLSENEIKEAYNSSSARITGLDIVTSQDREQGKITCELSGKVTDQATGAVLDAKVSVTVDGKYYYPEKETLVWGNRKKACFLSTENGFKIKVPPGNVKINAARGLEYLELNEEINLKNGEKKEIVLPLKRLVDMPAAGWYGGEHHLHSTGHDRGQAYEFMERPDGWIWWARAVKAAGFHYVSSPAGHPRGSCESACSPDFICCATWEGGPLADETSKIRKSTHGNGICMINDIDAAEQEEGMAIPQGYIESPLKDGNFFNPAIFGFNRSFPVVVALGKAYVWDVYYRAHEVTQKDWYRYLNCGFKLGISHGSDAYLSQGPAPDAKEYTKLSALTWPEVIKGYKSRATFWTSGPLVIFRINDKEIGETVKVSGDGHQALNINIEAWDKSGLSRIEILKNGKVERTVSFDAKPLHSKFNIKLNIAETCWIALRIYGGGFAHTSPIYVQFGEKPMGPPKEDIEYFLGWLEKYRQFIKERLTPTQPPETRVTEKDAEQVLKWIGEAESVYKGLQKPENYRKW